MLQSCWLFHGRKHFFQVEMYGSKGNAIFVSERLNELKVCEMTRPRKSQGFTDVLIGKEHPYGDVFNLKTGMGIGIKESFTIQLYDFVDAILHDKAPSPDFIDGYEAQRIMSAIQDSSEKGMWVRL